MYKEIFRATQIASYVDGWIVDLSPANVVNPDYYWRFSTRTKASAFVALLDIGLDADHAAYLIEEYPQISKTRISKIKTSWRNGRNIWEISQITDLPEPLITTIVQYTNT